MPHLYPTYAIFSSSKKNGNTVSSHNVLSIGKNVKPWKEQHFHLCFVHLSEGIVQVKFYCFAH